MKIASPNNQIGFADRRLGYRLANSIKLRTQGIIARKRFHPIHRKLYENNSNASLIIFAP
jgi:hypothetical protein